MQLGEGVFIEPDVYCFDPDLSNINLGDRVYINRNVSFDNYAQISVGTDTAIGMGTTIVTSTHHLGPEHRRGGKGYKLPVSIGRGCWIGANVTILPGVKIGNGVVVGAGALVNRDLESNSVYAGVPAKLVRAIAVCTSCGDRP